MQEFVEFKGEDYEHIAVKTGYVTTVAGGDTGTYIAIDGDNGSMIIDEPYDKVMKKLKEAEGYEAPVVEHFTRDEYKLLNQLLFEFLFGDVADLSSRQAEFVPIHQKLQNIIRGEE